MNARFTGRGNDLPLCLADIAAAPLQIAEDDFDYDDCYDGDDEAERDDHAASPMIFSAGTATPGKSSISLRGF